MMGLMLAGQYVDGRIWMAPAIALAALIVFAGTVSLTNSERFYATLNSVSPLKLADPVRWVLRRQKSRP